MKRVRYIKGRKEGIQVTARNLRSDSTGALYKVTLDLNEMTYKIYNINSERIVKRGGGVTLEESLKAKAKRDLSKLGVKFEHELRRNDAQLERMRKRREEKDAN